LNSCPDNSRHKFRGATRRRHRSCCSQAPARTTNFKGPAASIGSVTFVPRTMRTSGCSLPIASTSASSFRSGWKEISQPDPPQANAAGLFEFSQRLGFA
jgi:hypothetical protein